MYSGEGNDMDQNTISICSVKLCLIVNKYLYLNTLFMDGL